MTEREQQCHLCRGPAGDPDLVREQVWEDDLWRLTVAIQGEIPGFAYLEPKRHIPYITDLDGAEAASFGATIARASRALREAAGAELVFVYVFGGGIPHLHVHLAPHREGDGLNTQIIQGEFTSEVLPSGATMYVSKDYPPRPEAEMRTVAERVRASLAAAR